jgi:hypothetical protein
MLGRLGGGDGFEEEAGVAGAAAPPAPDGAEVGEISMGLDG